MYPKITVNLGNLVLSLSDALDLAFPSLAMHQQRAAFIAWEVAKQANLDGKRLENIFIAGLLHDIGALSIEEKKSLHDNETSGVEQHCIRGRNLFKSSPWLEPCADLVRYHHRGWIMWKDKRDTSAVFDSQILFLADYLERQVDRKIYILHQEEVEGAANDNHNTQTTNDIRRNFSMAVAQDKGNCRYAGHFPDRNLGSCVLCQLHTAEQYGKIIGRPAVFNSFHYSVRYQ